MSGHDRTRDLTARPSSHSRTVLTEHDVGLVVCNAGATHGIGAFLDAPLEKALQLVRLNCLAPLIFARKALSRRRGRGAGLIVVSSMSGLCGTGLIATYAAVKAFAIALCAGLHWALGASGLDVLCAVAGLTDTPAMRRSGLSFSAAAKGYQAMSAEVVAQGALEQLGRVEVWYAVGEATAGALRQLPRPQLTAAMSEASAAMYGVNCP
jgi:short-subunit dehydrogenase